MCAAFTRDWDESTPTDSTNANEIDDYNRYLRVDCSDRLKDMIYGFTAGENDGVQGFKQVEFKQQASAASQPNADEIVLYAIDDGSNCGLYAQNEDGYKTQLLKKIGSTFTIPSGAFGADAIDEDDIRLSNNAYLTARNNADDGDINIIKVNASDVPEILVGAVLSADTAPASDAAISNKKYVDDQITALAFGSMTDQDDDNNTMVKDHAYLANQDGWVYVSGTSLSAGVKYGLYIDTDTNPVSGGTMIPVAHTQDGGICAAIKSGEYFEVAAYAGSTATIAIYWRGRGTTVKPTDQD